MDIIGIIFVVSLENINNLDESSESLKRIIIYFINNRINVYIIFNKSKYNWKIRLDWYWILESRLNIPKLIKLYKINK